MTLTFKELAKMSRLATIIGRTFHTSKKGELLGPLTELVWYVLELIDFPVDAPLDRNRVEEMFNKQTPGVIERVTRGKVVVFRVRVKPFRNWVRHNAVTRRLFKSRRQEHKEMMVRIQEDFEWEQQEASEAFLRENPNM